MGGGGVGVGGGGGGGRFQSWGGGVDFRVFLLNQFPCLHNSSNLLSAVINQHKGQKLTEKEQLTKPRKEKAESKVTLTQVFSLEC